MMDCSQAVCDSSPAALLDGAPECTDTLHIDGQAGVQSIAAEGKGAGTLAQHAGRTWACKHLRGLCEHDLVPAQHNYCTAQTICRT